MYSTDYTGMYLTGMYYDIIYRIVGKCTVLYYTVQYGSVNTVLYLTLFNCINYLSTVSF